MFLLDACSSFFNSDQVIFGPKQSSVSPPIVSRKFWVGFGVRNAVGIPGLPTPPSLSEFSTEEITQMLWHGWHDAEKHPGGKYRKHCWNCRSRRILALGVCTPNGNHRHVYSQIWVLCRTWILKKAVCYIPKVLECNNWRIFVKSMFTLDNRLRFFMDIFPIPASLPDTVSRIYSYLERPFEGTEEESEKVDEECTRTTQSGQDEEEQRKTRAQWERRLWLLSDILLCTWPTGMVNNFICCILLFG